MEGASCQLQLLPRKQATGHLVLPYLSKTTVAMHLPRAAEERERLKAQYETRIKQLDAKVKAVRAKVGAWVPKLSLL
jgi:hypothetical protein